MPRSQKPHDPTLSYKERLAQGQEEALELAVAFAQHFGIDGTGIPIERIDDFLNTAFYALAPTASTNDGNARRSDFLERIRHVCTDAQLLGVFGVQPFDVFCQKGERAWYLENVGKAVQRFKPVLKVESQARTSLRNARRHVRGIDKQSQPQQYKMAQIGLELTEGAVGMMQKLGESIRNVQALIKGDDGPENGTYNASPYL